MTDTGDIPRLYKERTDQEIRAQLKKRLRREPVAEELASVRVVFEDDIEEHRYYYGNDLLLRERWTATGNGYFTATGSEPYATFLHTAN